MPASEMITVPHAAPSDSLQRPLRVVGLFAGIGGIEAGLATAVTAELRRAGVNEELIATDSFSGY
jgi:hypothetical protein